MKSNVQAYGQLKRVQELEQKQKREWSITSHEKATGYQNIQTYLNP